MTTFNEAKAGRALSRHVQSLLACTRCPRMFRPPVSGGPVVSRVVLIGQAPGIREPVAGRPFAWTAGRTLFRWLEQATGLDETAVRTSVYFAAVCRCFPGKNPAGGDRVPSEEEMANCAPWLQREIEILRPRLIIAVGRLAISRLLGNLPLDQAVGRVHRVRVADTRIDLVPLPHPSGASTWPHREPGKRLLAEALRELGRHPAMRALVTRRATSAR